jgi:hypothetical protein
MGLVSSWVWVACALVGMLAAYLSGYLRGRDRGWDAGWEAHADQVRFDEYGDKETDGE